MLEKLVRISLLYDFYGPLLTEKQRRCLELYYHQDWTLSEVAGFFNTTRQAVHDLMRRSEAALETYEARLGLVQRFTRQRALLSDLEEQLQGLQEALPDEELAGRIRRSRRLVRQLTEMA